jgi:hypothetical protein
MKTRTPRGTLGLALSLSLFLLAAAGGWAAAGTPMSTDGTIAAVNPGSIILTSSSGEEKTVSLAPETLVLSRETADLKDLAVGEAMGVDAKRRPDGTLRAVAINIFSPELWKVVRKGQWPMDSGDVMTNAVVTQASLSTMENGTITLTYQDVTAVITLPSDTVVKRVVTLRPDDLKPGAHVTIRGTSTGDGSLEAAMVFEDKPEG